MREQVIVVDENADTLTALYDDKLAGLGEVLEVNRASNVEWGLVPGSKGWDVRLTYDLRLGYLKGRVVLNEHKAVELDVARRLAATGKYHGFKSRVEALAVEVQFLNRHVLRA